MSIAESVGFEPTEPFRVHGLANRSINHSGNSPLYPYRDSNPDMVILYNFLNNVLF